MNIYVVKLKQLKRNFLAIVFLLFTFSLLIFSKSNLPAVKSGLSLWATSVVPSLFPFFVATELLMHTNFVKFLGICLTNVMKPIFNVRGEGAFAFIMGIISGYPIGAKIAVSFRQNGICSKEECERLLSFTNNSGPLFIIGSVGILMYGSTAIGALLFITHILACVTVGFIFRFWKYNKRTTDISPKPVKNLVSFSNLGDVLAESIKSSISTIFLIGGFVVIFSSIISIFKSSGAFAIILNIFHINNEFTQGFLTGLLEITNGIHQISMIACKKLSINLIITAFLLGFGGISVFLQVLSVTAKSDLSIKPYIIGKILQGLLAAFYTFVLINIFPFFNFDL